VFAVAAVYAHSEFHLLLIRPTMSTYLSPTCTYQEYSVGIVLLLSISNQLPVVREFGSVVIESWSQNSNSHFAAQLAAAVMTIMKCSL